MSAGAVADGVANVANLPKMFKPRVWKVPFVKEFNQDELVDGKAVGFKVKLIGPRAAFNIATGPSVGINTPYHEDNISLHILFQEGKGFLLSSLIDNEWGEQLKFDNVGVEVGEELYVRAEPHGDSWKVVVNGQAIGQYRYPVPLKECTHVYVEGDVELQKLQFEGSSYMVPFEYDLNNFGPGKLIWVSGIMDNNPKTLDVEFYSGDDIAFKFQARFADGFVVRNTRKNGEWGKDETDEEFPFKKGEEFTLEFDVVDDCFEVYVNDSGFTRYFHRMDPNSLTRFELKGDLALKNIDVQNT